MKTTEQLRLELEADRQADRIRLLNKLAELDPKPVVNEILTAQHLQQVVTGTDKNTAFQNLLSALPAVFAATVILSAAKWLGEEILTGPVLWITKGKVTKAFPAFQALRIVRKHKGWFFTKTEPKRPKRRISRWEGLKIFFIGDKDGSNL